ncbi:MAG: TetR/AcrR family transcriptional regulator [Pseudomonadota bacterium]
MSDYFRTLALGQNKRARTRNLLIDTAIDVFSDKGIEAASVQEITMIAGLANGTFYNHFKDKEELAGSVSRAIVLEIAKRLAEQMQGLDRGVTRVTVASWAFLRIAVANGNWARVLAYQFQRRPVTNTIVFQYMRADLELAAKQSKLDIEVDDFLLEQLASLMMAALHRQLEQGEQSAVMHRVCESMLRLLGLTPAQAKREVDNAQQHPLVSRVVSD